MSKDETSERERSREREAFPSIRCPACNGQNCKECHELNQARRQKTGKGKATMTYPSLFFVVHQRYYLQLSRCWVDDATVLDATTLDEASAELARLDGPRRVIEVDVAAGIAQDISRDVAYDLAAGIAACDVTETRDLRDFIELYWPVGSVMPAAK